MAFRNAHLALAALAALGCGEGGLSIRLALPEDPALSPTAGEPVAEVALVTRTGQGMKQRLSRSADAGSALDLGRLEGGEVSLAVELLADSGRLLGYGRAPEPVVIRPGADLEVAINVRRPMVYLSGHPEELATFDASRDREGAVIDGIALGQVATATATSADGSEIFAVTESEAGAELARLSTSSHRPMGTIAALAPRVGDLTVTSDGGFAVAAHRSTLDGSEIGGVTLLSTSEPEGAQRIELGDVRRVALDPGRGVAYALVEPAVICPLEEPPESQILEIELSAAGEPRALPWSGTASDLALDPETGILYVADPCRGAIMALDPGAAEPGAVFDLPAASAVAIHEGTLLAAGNTAGPGARLAVVRMELAGGEPQIVELPALQERAVSTDLEDPTQQLEMVADADAVAVVDLAAVPGSDRVALVSLAIYGIDAITDGVIELTPDMILTAWEYQLVDAGGSLIQRVRTLCDLDVFPRSNTVFVNWRCGQAPDQVLPSVEFEPRTINVLFGSR